MLTSTIFLQRASTLSLSLIPRLPSTTLTYRRVPAWKGCLPWSRPSSVAFANIAALTGALAKLTVDAAETSSSSRSDSASTSTSSNNVSDTAVRIAARRIKERRQRVADLLRRQPKIFRHPEAKDLQSILKKTSSARQDDKSATGLTRNDKTNKSSFGFGFLPETSRIPVPSGVWRNWRGIGKYNPIEDLNYDYSYSERAGRRLLNAKAFNKLRSWGITPSEAKVVNPKRPRKVQFSEQLVQEKPFFKKDKPCKISRR